MAFENFTVNVVSFPATVGLDWTNSYSQVFLTITPNSGYSIDANNFSPITPLPTYVSSVTFTQNGANIDCTIVYTSPSIMPAADVLIALCIQGYASEAPIIIGGTLKSGGITNVSIPAAGDLPSNFSGSGKWDSSLTVFTQSVVASTGYYFKTKPVLSISKGNRSEYTITSIETLDAKKRLIQVVFSVSYKFPAIDNSLDEFVLTANAIQYYDPPVKITAYQFNTGTVVNAGGDTRTFTIYGITGANWALTGEYTPGNISVVNTSGVIDGTGKAVVSIVFPATTNVNRTYSFTLTGDLAASFNLLGGQTSTPSVIQYIQSSLSLAFTSTNVAVSPGSPAIRYFLPYTMTKTVEYTVTATSSQTITVGNNPPSISWTGQDGALPDYLFNVLRQDFVVDNLVSPSTLTATIVVRVLTPGAVNFASVLDLDNILI
jgi:hypothetical protein|tara:strand:+ start:15866 stop:17161 length:1296 start_codon:yes stop_codon:yes gene_type:complete